VQRRGRIYPENSVGANTLRPLLRSVILRRSRRIRGRIFMVSRGTPFHALLRLLFQTAGNEFSRQPLVVRCVPNLEQVRLVRLFLVKVAQSHAHQPVQLRIGEVHPAPQQESDLDQLLARRRRSEGRETARENFEFPCLELQNDCPRDARFFARRVPCLFRQLADERFGLGERHVLRKCILRRDGLRGPVRDPGFSSMPRARS
jgi:hypothetical protein